MGIVAAALRTPQDGAQLDKVRQGLVKAQPSYLVGTSYSFAHSVSSADTGFRVDEDEDDFVSDDSLIESILKGDSWKAYFLLNARRGENLNIHDFMHRTPLFAAASMGDARILKTLIGIKVDLYKHGPFGWTPLHVAVFNGHATCVNALINAMADPNMLTGEDTRSHQARIAEEELEAAARRKARFKKPVTGERKTRKKTNEDVPAVGCLHMIASSPKLYYIELVTQREMKQRVVLRRRERAKQVSVVREDIEIAAMEALRKEQQTEQQAVSGRKRGFVAVQSKWRRMLPFSCLKKLGTAPANISRQISRLRSPKVGFAKKIAPSDALSMMFTPKQMSRKGRRRNVAVREFSTADLMRSKALLMWTQQPNRVELITYNALKKYTGLMIDLKDSNGKTPLLWAAQFGHLYLASRLLHDKANIESTDLEGQTALMYSVRHEHVEVVKFLVAVQANVMHADNFFQTPLHLATTSGNRAISQFILESKGDFNAVDAKGRTPTMIVMNKKDRALFTKILQCGPNLDHLDSHGWNVLIYAINVDFFQELVPLLNKLAVEVPQETFDSILLWQDPQGFTALHHAVQKNNLQFCKMLLQMSKARLATVQDCNGNSPLHEACLTGNIEIVATIVAELVDIDDPTNNWGETGLMLSARKGHVDCVILLLNEPRLMLCADASRKDASGKDFLMHACVGGSLDMLNLILVNRHGNHHILHFCEVDVNRQDNSGATALMMCAREGHWHLIPSLVMAKADVTIQDDDGFSALHWACMDNEVYGVLTLLDLRAAIDQQDNMAWSPVMHACSVGSFDVVRLLSERGCNLLLQSPNQETCFTIAAMSKLRSDSLHVLTQCMREQMRSVGVMNVALPRSGYFVLSVIDAVNLTIESTLPKNMHPYAFVQFRPRKNAMLQCATTTCVLGCPSPTWQDSFRFDLDGQIDDHAYIAVHLFAAYPDTKGELTFSFENQSDHVDKSRMARQTEKAELLQEKAKKEDSAGTRFLWDNLPARKWIQLETLQKDLPDVELPSVPRHHLPIGFLTVPFRILRDATNTADIVPLRNKMLRGAVSGRVNLDLEFRPQLWKVHQPEAELIQSSPTEDALVDYQIPKPLSPPRAAFAKPPVRVEGFLELLAFSKQVAEYEFDPIGKTPIHRGSDELLRELECVDFI